MRVISKVLLKITMASMILNHPLVILLRENIDEAYVLISKLEQAACLPYK